MKRLALLLLVPAIAHADPDVLYHVDAGVETNGARDIVSDGFRGQLLFGTSFGHGRVRPEIAAGAIVGAGTLYVPDPRAVSGDVGLSLISYGPAVQFGMQLYRDDEPTTRIFASAAALHVALDSRLMIDPVAGVGGDRGDREAIGVNLARTEVEHVLCSRCDETGILLFLLPQQLELTRESDAGSTRYGVAFSWGS